MNRIIRKLFLSNSYSKYSGCRLFTEKASVIKNHNLELTTKFKEKTFAFEYTLKEKTFKKVLPYVWLRNNCTCPSCYNQLTEEVELNLLDVPVDIKPSRVDIINDSIGEKNLEIIWQDGHKSNYDLVKMCDNLFDSEISRSKPESSPVFWDNQTLKESNGFPSFDYNSYLENENTLKQALQSIIKYGAVLIKNVPEKEKEIVKLCTRIAPIQNSIFGVGDIKVTSQLGFTDRAYTNMKLKAHTDTIFIKNSPGLEAFHVIKKADVGGESVFMDGFHCANLLKEQNPRAFEILTKTDVQAEFFKKGEWDLRFSDPLIKLNPLDGHLMQIRFNAYYNLNVSHLSADEMVSFYQALKEFTRILEDEKNHTWIGLEQNEIVIFDNFRLLHGRSEFEGNRTLITTYMPRDEWLSKARLLNAF